MTMTIDVTHVRVFRTNVGTHEEKLRIKNLLGGHPLIDEWSVDTEDVDRVLRVVSRELSASSIIELVTSGGFDCHELE
jgi:cell fate (sporulation/competence/biofilm development) regulator YmcA (YheA/YmcA/DUF963 family)